MMPTLVVDIVLLLVLLGFLALCFSAVLDSWNGLRLRQLAKSGALACRCSCPCLTDERPTATLETPEVW